MGRVLFVLLAVVGATFAYYGEGDVSSLELEEMETRAGNSSQLTDMLAALEEWKLDDKMKLEAIRREVQDTLRNRMCSGGKCRKKRCRAGHKPRRRHFTFIIEQHYTMGPACGDCPNTLADCFNKHCFTADGVERAVTTVNGQMPGPIIEVCRGDTIVVNVVNRRPCADTAIHWHGISQKGTPFMDGVPYVTQCTIREGALFRYEFVASEMGTHFWYSERGIQRVDGVVGALIVRCAEDPWAWLYEEDNIIMTFQDWNHEYSYARYPGPVTPELRGQKPNAILINGKGAVCTPQEGDEDACSSIPLTEFKVHKSKSHRIRIINMGGLRCPLQLQIEKHEFTVIAADGYPVKPVIGVRTLICYPGERYDVILSANQRRGAYWIIVKALGACAGDRIYQRAVLVYEGAESNWPSTPNPGFEGFHLGMVLNPLNSDCIGGPNSGDEMGSDETEEETEETSEEEEPPTEEPPTEEPPTEEPPTEEPPTEEPPTEEPPTEEYPTEEETEEETEEDNDTEEYIYGGKIRKPTTGKNKNNKNKAQKNKVQNNKPQNNKPQKNKPQKNKAQKNKDKNNIKYWRAAGSGSHEEANGVCAYELCSLKRHKKHHYRSSSSSSDGSSSSESVERKHRKFVLNFNFHEFEVDDVFGKKITDNNRYIIPHDDELKLIAGQIDGVSLSLPANLILGNPDIFAAAPHLRCRKGKTHQHCCNMIDIDLGDVVDIILHHDDEDDTNAYPFHLHGYQFEVLYQGYSLEDAKMSDKKNKFPSLRDTIVVPPTGYTRIRFIANNPGVWLLKSQFVFPKFTGMALIFKVGEVKDLPPLPEGFPTCGNFIPNEPPPQSSEESGSSSSSSSDSNSHSHHSSHSSHSHHRSTSGRSGGSAYSVASIFRSTGSDSSW